MKFKEANSILSRRYSYRMRDIPTDAEVEEAEKAFGIYHGSLCNRCKRFDECCMAGADTVYCNFFSEAKDELT